MKLDAFTQMKPPPSGFNDFPRGCQGRLDSEISSPTNQTFVDIALKAKVKRFVQVVWVQRIKSALESKLQLLSLRRQGHGECGQKTKYKRARFHYEILLWSEQLFARCVP
jgi:hypothetical protein